MLLKESTIPSLLQGNNQAWTGLDQTGVTPLVDLMMIAQENNFFYHNKSSVLKSTKEFYVFTHTKLTQQQTVWKINIVDRQRKKVVDYHAFNRGTPLQPCLLI